jgi:hypothetical protein
MRPNRNQGADRACQRVGSASCKVSRTIRTWHRVECDQDDTGRWHEPLLKNQPAETGVSRDENMSELSREFEYLVVRRARGEIAGELDLPMWRKRGHSQQAIDTLVEQ